MVTNWAVSEIDLSDAGFWGRPFGERDAAFGVLRRERPVTSFPEPALPLLPPGPGFWALTRFEDVARASREPGIFSSAHGSVLPDLPPGPPFSYLRSMIDTDDPGHARMRRLAAAAFTPRGARRISGQVEAACQEIIDEVIERGECDFAAEVALPLPARLICDLLGVPRADQGWVIGQALIAYGRDDPEYVPGVLEDPGQGALAVLDAAQQLARYAQELSRGKRARPGDDLVSRLATADLDGEPLTGEQLAQWFILLVIAGTETTRQAISHGVLVLDRHPDLEVTGDPQWLRSSAINGIKHLPVRFTPSRRGG